MAILLLAPSPPLLFMGEEFGAETPFLFFCDFGPELADKVRDGRRAEFARFEQFSSPEAQAKIPDANSIETFMQSKLDWNSINCEPHRTWVGFYRELLQVRREKIVPLVSEIVPGEASFKVLAPEAVEARWPLLKAGCLQLIANFSPNSLEFEKPASGHLLYASPKNFDAKPQQMPALAAAWFLNA
jgi:1,4-alpha-glucan branching enzyme